MLTVHHAADVQHAIRRFGRTAAAIPRGSRATHRVTLHQQHASAQSEAATSLDRHIEVVQELSFWASSELPRYCQPAELNWQPADFLPDPTSDAFMQQLSELREEAQKLPNDVLVVLAGLVIVLSTNPNQLSAWCGTPVLAAESGADQQPWARWRRSCAAARNRHRQLLLFYASWCGCIDPLALDMTMQQAITAGSSSSSDHQDPYQQLITGAMQARMLRVMFTNLIKVAAYHGATGLADIATAISADEGRHELAQVAALGKIFEKDPKEAVHAFAAAVQNGVVLPGCQMDDSWHVQGNSASRKGLLPAAAAAEDSNKQQQQQQQRIAGSECSQLYVDFMAAADAVGVYTVNDTAAAVQQYCDLWKVSDIAPDSQAVAQAQQYLKDYPTQCRRLAELQLEGRLRARRRERTAAAAFSWVGKREVPLS